MSDQHQYEGSPEKYLTADASQDEIDQNAINCAILRAQATVALLHSQFSSNQNIERVTDNIILDALWGLTGYLDQIKILTKI